MTTDLVNNWLGEMSSHEYHPAMMDNLDVLRDLGLLEEVWLQTYMMGRPHTVQRKILPMLPTLDPERLREAGDPIPEGSLTLYRGVSGRHVRGLSWTGSLDCARWFAGRGPYGFREKGGARVYALDVPAERVIAYTNERMEDEYLVNVTAKDKPRLLERVTENAFLAVVEKRRVAESAFLDQFFNKGCP